MPSEPLFPPRAGFWRRFGAFAIDMLICGFVIGILGTAAFALSGGQIQTGPFAVVISSCTSRSDIPPDLAPPPPAGSNSVADCTFGTIPGFPMMRTLVVGRETKSAGRDVKITESYLLAADGSQASVFDASWLGQLGVLAYLAVFLGLRGITPGMRILRIRMVSLSNPDGIGVPLLKLAIRVAVVVAGLLPAAGFGIAAFVWLSRDPEHAPIFTLVLPALVSVAIWSVWNAILIGRKRDPIYDHVSGLAVVRLVRHDRTRPLETVGLPATITRDEPAMSVDASDTIVIRSNRWKTAKTTLLMALMVALFVFAIAGGHDVALMIPGLIFVSVFCVLGVISTIHPPTLTVDAYGIRVAGLRSWGKPWTDIERFRLIQFRRSPSVVIDYRSDREAKGLWARFRQPKGLPGALWMRPVELQELLQARLNVARAADPNTSTPNEAASPVAEPTTAFPWASVVLILALGLAFAAEIAFPVTPATASLQPSVMTLMGFGGISRSLLTGPDQWYRFVASAFLHASLAHLIGNCVALFLAGRLLEKVVGRGWFLAIYAFGALTGALGSLAFNPSVGVSVGASGAIVALFAATLVCSFRFAPTAGRYRLQSGAFTILLPTLLTFGRTAGGMTVDFGDHLGGALGGALAGLWLVRSWGASPLLPARQRVGWIIACLCGLAVVAAVWPVATTHVVFEKISRLAPANVMPKDDAAVIQQAHSLLERYPDDPRLRLAEALGGMSRGDASQAEQAAREGITDIVPLRGILGPEIEGSLWQTLGRALAIQKRNAEARQAFDNSASVYPANASIDMDRADLDFSENALESAVVEAKRFADRSPKAWDAWQTLGDVQFARGDLAAALSAYDRLLDLKASSPAYRRVRGVVRFYIGDAKGALDDLQAAQAAEPDFLYGLIWLDIVRAREHVAVPRVYPGQAGVTTAWPDPVLAIFSDSFDPATLLGIAKADPSKPGEDYVCEADFYTAEWDRSHARETDAKAGFAKVVQECPPRFVETWMAKAELKLAEADLPSAR